jgi:DnaJ-class molecular chaperone
MAPRQGKLLKLFIICVILHITNIKHSTDFINYQFPDDEVKKMEGGLRMEKINRAYFCVGEDEERRRRYDQYGDEGVGSSAASEQQMKEAGGPGMMGGGFGGGAVDVSEISDIFDAFFGGGGGRGRSAGGQRKRNANAPVAGF